MALPILKKWEIPATVFVSTSFLDGGIMWNDAVLEAVRLSKATHIDLSSFELGVFPLGEKTIRRESAHLILDKIKHLEPSRRQAVVEYIVENSGELPVDMMLTTDQLKQLADGGVEIGAHTHTHPILARLTIDDALEEIAISKSQLEKILGHKVRFFAYPNGRLGSDYEQCHSDMVRDLGFEAALSTHWGVSSKNTDRWQMPRFTPWDTTSVRFMLRLLWNQRNLVE